MATPNFITQPCSVGIHRGLQVEEREHVVCLLRVIERLPVLTEKVASDPDSMRRQLETIRTNHLELAALASRFLTPETGEQRAGDKQVKLVDH